MGLNPVVLIFAGTVLAYVLWSVVYNLFLSPLSKFPGPKLAACTYIPTIYWTSSGKNHTKMKELHDKYGDVVRVGPNALVYRSPKAWKDIYGHRKSGAGSFLKDSQFYVRGPTGPNILNADDADHSRERRLLSHAFSEKALRDQESLIQSYVDLMVDRLNEQIEATSGAIDMCRWYNFTTFDIIGDLAFGEPFNCLQEGKYHPWVKMVFLSVKGGALLRPLQIYPSIAPIVKMLLPKRIMRMRNEHFAMSAEKVHRRLETKTERPDFMTYILRHTDDRAMTAKEMEANAALLIVAGSETTATLLAGVSYYLVQNPAAYKRLVEEIRSTFKSYDDINFMGVSQLTYLNAALEEALRVYPPVPGVVPRVVPKGGSIIDGIYVPEGVSVSGAHYSTYHAESNFAEADSFIPERWLEDREKRFESDNRSSLVAFSLGPRNCIGKNLAYAEMRVIVAKAFWSFDMALDKSSEGWDIQKSFNIWEKKPLMMHLTKVQH
ncbi:Cytochrome monooxygenase lcsI [Penicillium longicatenatum]|uniref:Cytochrome monooxygenase lcsI n=1 Tax=Penicillium longicatenatum TaxID=1561947 RepID=UPI00254766CA|nr:Cytochrome monooxygenase lcsI [Penicillium longicatenatum]KAJ5635777.1 Cytochrome monooxygenase lcsI [Penicillium longicatenatum]